MGLFKKKFKDWPIVTEGKSLLVEGTKQVPFLGRIITAWLDRGEKGKFSFNDFEKKDIYALGVGAVIVYGITQGWFTLAELSQFVDKILSVFN